jgi:hypothetical protein
MLAFVAANTGARYMLWVHKYLTIFFRCVKYTDEYRLQLGNGSHDGRIYDACDKKYCEQPEAMTSEWTTIVGEVMICD